MSCTPDDDVWWEDLVSHPEDLAAVVMMVVFIFVLVVFVGCVA